MTTPQDLAAAREIVSLGDSSLFGLTDEVADIIAKHRSAEVMEANARAEQFRNIGLNISNEVEQILGKALGYPWFKDDQKNFPGATEADGVCVGEHVAQSIADEAASKIQELQRKLDEARALVAHYAKDNIELFNKAIGL